MNDLSGLKIDKAQRESTSGGKINWVLLAFVMSVVVLLAVGIFFLGGGKGVVVQTVAAQIVSGRTAASRGLTASGYVVPQRKALVASKATGRIVFLGVKEGDSVRQGQLLARIEEADVAAKVLQVRSALLSARSRLIEEEANVVLAKTEYQRQEGVYRVGGVTQSQLETFKNRVAVGEAKVQALRADVGAAQALLKAAEVEFENTRIVAPFSGTVLAKGTDLGEVVSPVSGSAQSRGYVVSLADMSTLEVEADVSESNIGKVSIGQACSITLDAYTTAKYDGSVSAIVPTANRSKATILTKVKFKQLDNRVLPEMSAKVVFLESRLNEADTTSRLTIPLTAVTTVNGKKSVFLVEGEKAFAQEIQTGVTVGTFLEVKSGIAAGVTVVNNPPKELRDGQRVTVEKN